MKANLAKCSFLAKEVFVHLSSWYRKLALEGSQLECFNGHCQKPKKLTLEMLKGGGPRQKNVAAFFDSELEIERECRLLEEIQCLQYEIEDYYQLSYYQITFQTQLKMRAIQVTLYGDTSWQVLDTDYEILGLLSFWTTVAQLEKDCYCWESIVCHNIAARVYMLKDLGSRTDPFPDQKESNRFIYPYGRNCSKIMMAYPLPLIKLFDGETQEKGKIDDGEGALRLKLCQGAFEDRLEKFGLDSLLTLTAQRLYYITGWHLRGRDFAADIRAKKSLVHKLHQLMGYKHQLCQNLDTLLGIESRLDHSAMTMFPLAPQMFRRVREFEIDNDTGDPLTLPQTTELRASASASPPKKKRKKKSKKKHEPEAVPQPETPVVRKKHASSNGYDSCSSFTSEVNLRDCGSSDSGTVCKEALWFTSGSGDHGFTSPSDDEEWIPEVKNSWKSTVEVSKDVAKNVNILEHQHVVVAEDLCEWNEVINEAHFAAKNKKVTKTSSGSDVKTKKKERKKYLKNSETGEKVATIVTVPTTDSIHEFESSTVDTGNPTGLQETSSRKHTGTGPAPEAQTVKKTLLPEGPQTPKSPPTTNRKLHIQKPPQNVTTPPSKKSPAKPASPPKTPPEAPKVLRPPTPQQDPIVKASKDQWQTFVTINGPQDPQTLTLKFKHAECLLKDHQYDQAFNFLLELYPIEAQQRGYNHEVPMTILSQLCSTSLCKEFLSFQVLQAVKSVLDNEVATISVKLPKNHRTTIKTQFFQGYLTWTVDDNIVEAGRMMTAARDTFRTIHGPSDADFFFNWKIAMNLVNFRGQEWRANTLFDQAKTRIPKNSKRLKILYEADAALIQAKLFQYNHAWTEIKKTYSKASISENQKPNDPIVIHVLEVALEIIEMIQTCDTVEDIEDLSLFRDAYDRQELLLGPWHPNAVKVAIIYCAANYNPQKANKDKDYKLPEGLLSICTITVDRSNCIFGPVHQVTTRAKQVLAGLLSIEGGQTGLLKRHLSEAVRDRKSVFGEKHEAYYGLCKRASVIYDAIGDLQAAAKYATIWKNGSEGKHGINHSESSKAKKTVRKVLNEQNRRFGAV